MSRSASLAFSLMLALLGGAYGQTLSGDTTLAKEGAPDAPSAISLVAVNPSAEPGEGVPAPAEVAVNPLSPKPPQVRGRTVDRRFVTWMILANATTVLDVESTIHALNTSPAVYETQSWFYGQHPNRARLYGTAVPLNFAASYVSYVAKKRFCPSAHCWLWQLPLGALSAAHGAAGLANYARF